MPQVKKTEKKMVKIKLFKDSERYKNDVFVSLNGENYLIKRGVEVEVPDYIATILEQSAYQDSVAIDKRESLQSMSYDKQMRS